MVDESRDSMLVVNSTLFSYKLGQTLLQIWAVSLLQIGASFVTNWGSYYKLGQNLLRIGAGIRNYGNYYKSGHSTVKNLTLN